MRADELAQFQEALIDRKRQLSNWIEHLTQDARADSPALAGEVSSAPTPPADLGTNASEQAMELGLAGRTAQEVHEIDAALSRIESGTYGSCERCGRPISIDRLRARPWAVRCSDCQAALESS